MKEKLLNWAERGDGDCMYKLATIYRAEKNFPQYEHWLQRAAAADVFDAMKEYADNLRGTDDKKALDLYKKLAETFNDEEAMDRVVDMYGQSEVVDKAELKFILELIDKNFNDIYLRQNFSRMFTFKTLRPDECTMEYLQAVERRRIGSRIRKLLSDD